MSTTRKPLARRILASIGATALGVVGVAGLATTAMADDDGGGEDPTPVVNLGNINPEEDASLIIHKYDGNPGLAGNGTAITDTESLGNALSGVKFSVCPVLYNSEAIDLTTYQGWVDAQGANITNVLPPPVTDPPTPAGPYSLGACTEVTTINGVATYPATGSAAFGLYFVTETDPGDNLIVSPVQDFLVSIPYPNADGWLYDVHVYPKNKVDNNEPEKTVTDPGANFAVGDTLTWTITKELPALATGGTFTKLIITDQVDGRLALDADDVTVTVSDVALVDGDYTVTVEGNLVTVTFNKPGLAKLEAGKTVTVVLETTVETLGEDEFTNQAFVNVNDAVQGTGEPTVYWGSVELTKKDAANQALLSGAKFELYDSINGTKINTTPALLVTDADGTFTVNGLWVGTSADAEKEYCLKEIEAPAGYTTPTGDAAWTCFDVAADGLTPVEVSVDNTKQTGPTLPLTGASGTLLMTIGGIGLVAVAGGLYLATRRKAHQE
ncbi:SpaH/EbpB family LPXTG-anchored major pilin [Schaalia sp. JY-X159]|uniref:SpaH/EbpB family LPXTG-anchored major pilin n=1 Tax=Schaalia sp. JY-X159 TaxID=2758575 RepID=UPI00165D7535|nr:SpaH/EbpB family LPXTG-anchored major pilin [Schaalia sp. JY-X159]